MATQYTDPSVHESREHRREEGEQDENNNLGGYVPNEDLGEPPATRLVRAPADADAIDMSEDGGVCFACVFAKRKVESDPFNASEARDAYDDMEKLIADNYARGVSNPHLVDLVYSFYEQEIRPIGNYDAWTKTSIARHLLYHTNSEDVIVQEMTNILYSQIQSLRPKTWVENVCDGSCEPHHKNILLMDKLMRGLDDHFTKRKARKT